VIKTYGLTHLALAVRSVERASKFYRQVFGAVEVYRSDGFVQLQTPGSRDVLVLERKKKGAGRSGGIAHFGFRLQDPKDIGAAARAVKKAGGRIKEQGEFVPGEPYLFATDPDGYEIEIWYELPTPVDPKPRSHENTKPRKRRASTRRAPQRPARRRLS
jgi:catechol 2,3-dioxygenase-like lactoylglutathione lyase family enzyme